MDITSVFLKVDDGSLVVLTHLACARRPGPTFLKDVYVYNGNAATNTDKAKATSHHHQIRVIMVESIKASHHAVV